MKALYDVKYAQLFCFNDPISIIGRAFWRWSEADRFGIMNDGLPYNFIPNPAKPIPTVKSSSPPLRDLCLARAEKLLARARSENKKIAILWSGGVDSTSIIASLYLVGATKDDLIIVHTDQSINEYQEGFLDMTYKFKFDMRRYVWNDCVNFFTKLGHDVIFVVGWCADQLFGSDVNQRHPELYLHEWKNGLRTIVSKTFANARHVTTGEVTREKIVNAVEAFGDYAQKIGIELKYTCEALWLFNFGIKWSHVSNDFILTLDDPVQRNNTVTFYEDITFQEWTLANYKSFHEHNQNTDIKYYKRPLKELIFEMFKDKNYLNNKGKGASWKSQNPVHMQYSPMRIYDEEGIHTYDLSAGDENESYFTRQLLNRRKYMLPYLKPHIDVEKYLAGQNW